MDIFQKVVDAIIDEMELSADGVEILRKAAENPQDFGYLAEGLGADAEAVAGALKSAEPAALTVDDFAGQLGVEADAVSKLLWQNARFREDLEADSLDLVGLIIALVVGLAQFGTYAVEYMPYGSLFTVGGLSLLAGVLLCLIGAGYPALVAARMRPVEALRVEE